MVNVTHILPVLQWLEVVIAFVSSYICFLVYLFFCYFVISTECAKSFHPKQLQIINYTIYTDENNWESSDFSDSFKEIIILHKLIDSLLLIHWTIY